MVRYVPVAKLDVLRDRAAIPPARWRARLVFATMARRGSYFDPERNAAVYDTGPLPPPPAGSWVHDEWMPEYVELSTVSAEERLNTLITSSAIPLFFPTFVRQRGVFCDGGLVDNVPVLPLVTTAHCDIIIVVSLDRGTQADKHGQTECKKKVGSLGKVGANLGPDLHPAIESRAEKGKHCFRHALVFQAEIGLHQPGVVAKPLFKPVGRLDDIHCGPVAP